LILMRIRDGLVDSVQKTGLGFIQLNQAGYKVNWSVRSSVVIRRPLHRSSVDEAPSYPNRCAMALEAE